MRKKNTAIAAVASLLILLTAPHPALTQSVRDYVYVVGSSTVYPFSTIVAERFGRGSRFKTPKVESTGSGGGMKLFCAGIGTSYPDIVNASRRITPSEANTCIANGVGEIVEVRIGYDGIVFANAVSSPRLDISSEQLFLALARYVPGEAPGDLIDNPYTHWSQIGPDLPELPIEVLGPPPTSGTRDAFAALVLEAGCRRYSWIADLQASDPSRYRQICHTLREDGRYIDAGENDNLIVQKLQANSAAFGIIGFSFLDQNMGSIQGSLIDGESPDFDSIAIARYPVSRSLYFYVKKAHVPVIPGLREFLSEFTSERTWGDDGYLSYRGLVPLSVDERLDVATRVDELRALTLASQ